MIHNETTNTRVLHQTLVKLRLLKEAYGFKTLFETTEYVVQKVMSDQTTMMLLEKSRLIEELNSYKEELRAQTRN